MSSSKRSDGANGVKLGLSILESTRSGEVFVRDLPRERGLGTGRLSEFLAASVPRMESFKDDNDAGMKGTVRGNPAGLLLLDEEGEPRDLSPDGEDSSGMVVRECGGESGSEMTTEMVRERG